MQMYGQQRIGHHGSSVDHPSYMGKAATATCCLGLPGQGLGKELKVAHMDRGHLALAGETMCFPPPLDALCSTAGGTG